MIFICYLESWRDTITTRNHVLEALFQSFSFRAFVSCEKEINFEGFVMVKGINCLKKLFNASFVVFLFSAKKDVFFGQ